MEITTSSPEDAASIPPTTEPPAAKFRIFHPAFSPSSCYLLRDQAEEAYFARHGGAPEAKLIDWATQFIAHDEIFVDVGAHVGTWAQHFALKCKLVHAFEPQRSTYERLRDGVKIAKLGNVTCHDVALGGSGEIDLHVVSVDGGGSTLRHRPELGAVLAVEQVHCVQLDDFEFENVGLIKIDAEGYEIDILRGAAKTLERNRPTLLLEAWDHEWYARERAELIAHVISLGYGVVNVSGWPQMLLIEPTTKRKKASGELSAEKAPATEGTSSTDKPELASRVNEHARAFHTKVQHDLSRPLLGLVMIVKNEAKRIAAVLASYRPYIDGWTILDTGSTDGTQDMIRGELSGIPGTLYEEPFVDFATSRNRALDLHGTSTVFSIMPNGDVLSGGAELVSFLDTRRGDLFSGAYRVRISPGHYYHPLVMRTGFGWRYKWRTHECAMGPNQGPLIPGVMVMRDRGQRTDAEWRQRWERDLVLLHKDREADPSDPRPYFYLGQTHECLGNHAEALVFFEQRAEMGGYFDEVYEAKFRIAKMMQAIKRPWAEVQQKFLEAYAHDPRRAEPLYAIAEHWYDLEQHAISRMFSVAAAELPKPPTDLFLDEEIYTWRAKDKAAISCFYSGHKEEGRRFAEDAVWKRPHDERLRANWSYFAQSAGEMFGMQARPIAFQPESGWSPSNPSIYRHAQQLRCIVRTVNYRIVDGKYVTPPGDVVHEDGPYRGWQVIRTRNFLLDLDDDLKTTRSVELVDKTGMARTSYPVRGFEDARLFWWRGKWWATATVCDFTEDGKREIALLEIDDDGSVVRAQELRGVWSDQPQKNWMPAVGDDSVKFVYATSPTDEAGPATVFELVDAEAMAAAGKIPPGTAPFGIRRSADAPVGHGRLRGGSQAIRFDDGWICLVHDVAFPGSGRIYLHRFARFDDRFRLVAMSDPFYFEHLGIEFCAGIAQVRDQLVVSYAINDGSARLGIFETESVRASLRDDFVI